MYLKCLNNYFLPEASVLGCCLCLVLTKDFCLTVHKNGHDAKFPTHTKKARLIRVLPRGAKNTKEEVTVPSKPGMFSGWWENTDKINGRFIWKSPKAAFSFSCFSKNKRATKQKKIHNKYEEHKPGKRGT